jgi:antitoxin (DNA-binding transcriptional repressor) of toxin-antitoxin stability system
MEALIAAIRAARTFSALPSRVRYRGETFVIERGGEPIGRLLPASPAHAPSHGSRGFSVWLPRPDRGYQDTLEVIITR